MNFIRLSEQIGSYMEHINNELVEQTIKEIVDVPGPDMNTDEIKQALLPVFGTLSYPIIAAIVEYCNAGQIKEFMDELIHTTADLKIQKETNTVDQFLQDVFSHDLQMMVDVV